MTSAKVFLIGIASIFIIVSESFSQEEAKNYRFITTNEFIDLQLKMFPELVSRKIEIDDALKELHNDQDENLGNINVKLRFLIQLSDNRSIPIEQLNFQIEALNEAFNILPTEISIKSCGLDSYSKLAANLPITFCPINEKDVFRFPSIGNLESQMEVFTAEIKDFLRTSSKDHINIIITELGENAGFASMPFSFADNDAIVIDYRYFGTGFFDQYSLGKTLVHLVSNYFGLYSLWQPDCKDDQVNDTPIHNSPNFECYPSSHVSLCGVGGQLEMNNNYLDNSDDHCLNMFTTGQIRRLVKSLRPGGPRSNLVNVEECLENRTVQVKELYSIVPNISDGSQVTLFTSNPSPFQNASLFDIIGNNVGVYTLYTGDNYVDLSNLSNGLYILNFYDDKSLKYTTKLIIQK